MGQVKDGYAAFSYSFWASERMYGNWGLCRLGH